MKFPPKGLYAITQTDHKAIDCILAEVTAALLGGINVLQYRDKNPADAVFLGTELVKLCHQYSVPLIINDDVALAKQVQADGVHLGKDDGEISHARNQLGSDAIVGVSCYNSLDRALAAQAHGASYVAFGRFFPSNSKPLAAPAQFSTLEQARSAINIPIVAIGGILPENGAQLLAAGADHLAVIGGLFDQDPKTAAMAYNVLFKANL